MSSLPEYCVACLSNKFEYLFNKNNYDIYKCLNCRTSVVWPLPTVNVTNNIYADDYFNSQNDFGYKDYMKTEDLTRNECRMLLEHLPIKKGKLLEIGSGLGFFLDEAEKIGFSVEGLELNIQAVEYSNKVLNKKVVCQKFENFTHTTKDYEVVVMLDIIEHLLDPNLGIKKVNHLLKNKGWLLLRTPNSSSKLSKEKGINWEQIKPPEHLYYFSQEGLMIFLRNAGFEIKNIKHIGGTGLCTGENIKIRLALAIIKRFVKFLKYLQKIGLLIAKCRGNLDTIIIYAQKKKDV